jgi:hypothetical protein
MAASVVINNKALNKNEEDKRSAPQFPLQKKRDTQLHQKITRRNTWSI